MPTTTRRAVKMARSPKGTRFQVYGFTMVEFGQLFGMTPASCAKAAKERTRRGKLVPPQFDPTDLKSIFAFACRRGRLTKELSDGRDEGGERAG